MDERIDVIEESGEPTGLVVWKSEAHRRGLRHRCFHCWICGADDDGPYLLVQRRAARKDTWPGYLDVTAAGHLAAGETPMDGLREVEEELGLRVSSERLEPLGSHLVEQEIPGGCDRELHDVFLLSDSTPPDKLRLQREEVESVVRIPLDAVEGMSGGAAVSALEYTEGAPRPIRIRISDFVADKEEYLFSVARESRRVLAGERAGRIF